MAYYPISKCFPSLCRWMLFLIITLSGNKVYCQGQIAQRADREGPQRFQYIPGSIDTAALRMKFNHAKSLMKRNLDSSIMIFKEVNAGQLAFGDPDRIVSSFSAIAFCYFQKGDNEKSIFYYRKALKYAPEVTDKMVLIRLYTNMCAPWYASADFDSVAFYAYKAAELLPRLTLQNKEERKAAAVIYNNLGSMWLKIGKFNQALPLYKKAETIFLQDKDSFYLSRIYVGLGNIYLKQREMDSTFYYLNLASKYTSNRKSRLNNLKGEDRQADLQVNFGSYYLAVNQADKAIPYFETGIEMLQESLDKEKTTFCYFRLGEAYHRLGRYSESEHYLKEAFNRSEKHHFTDIELLAASNALMANINEIKGNYRQAYFWQMKGSKLLDNLVQKEKDRLADKLERVSLESEKNHEIAQKQLLIVIKDSQLKEKNYLIAGAALAATFLVILSISIYRSNKHKQKLQEEQIYTLSQEQEIRQLRATLKGEEKERARIARELHDGVASQLASVKFQLDHLRKRAAETIEPDEVDIAYLQLEDATTELRKTAHNLMPDIVVDNGLQIALGVFCNKMHQASNIEINFEVFGDIPRLHPDVELSIYRMVQELLQNVLKHAHATRVLVQIVYSDQLLSITIEDNGQGYNTSMNGNGAGLKNVQERVEQLNGNMNVDSAYGSGTTIYIEFDVFLILNHRSDVH